MTASGKTLYYFGIYVLCIGLIFLTIPEHFISLNKLPGIPVGWARVIGLLSLVIGSYDIIAGRAGISQMITASVYLRTGFATGVALLVLLGQMPYTLLLLGAIDAMGASWTMLALKKEANILK
jgi:hypothetical protein